MSRSGGDTSFLYDVPHVTPFAPVPKALLELTEAVTALFMATRPKSPARAASKASHLRLFIGRSFSDKYDVVFYALQLSLSIVLLRGRDTCPQRERPSSRGIIADSIG